MVIDKLYQDPQFVNDKGLFYWVVRWLRLKVEMEHIMQSGFKESSYSRSQLQIKLISIIRTSVKSSLVIIKALWWRDTQNQSEMNNNNNNLSFSWTYLHFLNIYWTFDYDNMLRVYTHPPQLRVYSVGD